MILYIYVYTYERTNFFFKRKWRFDFCTKNTDLAFVWKIQIRFLFENKNLVLYEKYRYGFLEIEKNEFWNKNLDLVFIDRKEWKNVSCDGFSCRSKILNRNLTLDLCMFINQHFKS